jgi:uncharacterized protein (TIGR02231 family)
MTQLNPEEPTTNLKVETAITAVTVYTNRALVTRRGKVPLSGSERELLVTGLPMTVQAESVRAGGVGTVGVKLLDVQTERLVFTEPVNEKVAALTQQIRDLNERRRAVQDQIEALHLRRNFVQGLGEKSVERFSQSLARQQVSLDETGNLLNFLGQQYTELAGAIATQEKERDALDRQLVALQRQLEIIRVPISREIYNLKIAIEPAGAGEFELEVSYLVNRAGWTPLYDLRVNSGSEAINLTYLAEVQQSSGEDWLGVQLTLSTAKPGLGSLPPKLDPWYIDVPAPIYPMAPPAARQRKARTDEGTDPEMLAMNAPMMASFAAAPAMDALAPQPVVAQSVAAEISNDSGVVTFRLDRDTDIPGDGAPHKITIFSDDYPSQTEYIAMPRLVSFAYLQASITNSLTGASLLPGAVNIFRDNVFIGTARLDNVAPGQEFKLNLGIDEGLKIERDLIERDVDKRFIGGQRRITFGYRLLVTNLRDDEVSLKLTEQLPVSRNEQIKVKLTRSQPQVQPGELGTLEWDFALPPKARREVTYQFTVEHPSDLHVTGLGI